MKTRQSSTGATLLEMLLALTLGIAVLGAFVGVLRGSLKWTESLILRAEALEVIRTIWVVLDEEVRPGLAGRDWTVDDEGVLRLRAFRGVGRICSGAEHEDRWVVAYRGRRLPEPARDSVLVLGVDGGWRAFDLVGVVGTGDCESEPGERVLTGSWSQPEAPAPALVRVFERGEYHLVDGAFRYRRGEGGRQPLTPERVGPESRFTWAGAEARALEVTIEILPVGEVGQVQPFEWTVSGMGLESWGME